MRASREAEVDVVSGVCGDRDGFQPGVGRRSWFDKMDADGDGNVTKDEMTARIAAHGHGAAGGPKVDDLFSKVDTNGDGAIDRTEDAAFRESRHVQRAAAVQQLLQGLFAKLDTNGDGNASADEVSALLGHSGGADGSSAGSGSALVSALDRNGDNQLSSDEFAAAVQARRPPGPPAFAYGRGGQPVDAAATDSRFTAVG